MRSYYIGMGFVAATVVNWLVFVALLGVFLGWWSDVYLSLVGGG